MKKFSMITLASLTLISVSSGASVFAAELPAEYESNAVVKFTPDTGKTDPLDPDKPDPSNPVDPWDPTTPDHKPNPGTDGPLSIDFASSIDFGVNKINSDNKQYYANPQYLWNEDMTDFDTATPRPNYVQISDKRGTNAGWNLQVKQNGQFSNVETQNKELTGAQLTLSNGAAASNSTATSPTTNEKIELPTNGDLQNVMSAAKGAGAGTWVDKFGVIEDVTNTEGDTVKKNKAIELDIPGSTPIDATSYTTTLTWVLSELPGNEIGE